MIKFYNEMIKTLTIEAKALNEKIKAIREKQNIDSNYITCIKALRDTIDIIHSCERDKEVTLEEFIRFLAKNWNYLDEQTQKVIAKLITKKE
jgi:hypothetical protein